MTTILKAIAKNKSWTSIILMALSFLFLVPHQPELAPKQNVALAFLVQLIITLAISVVLQLLFPPPKGEDAKKGGLDDFAFPTNMEQRFIPVSYGTNRLTGPNLIWYGDLVATPISVKSGGLFSSARTIVGWAYNLGFDLALCAGPISAITEVRINEKPIIQAGIGGIPSIGWSDLGDPEGIRRFVNRPDLHGGYKKGGGVSGNLRLYNGNATGAVNPYMVSKISEPNRPYMPGYPGLARVVWEGGYVGERTQIGKWDFTTHSYPNTLGVLGGKERIGPFNTTSGHGDANPVCCLYDIMTNVEYGLSLGIDDIDVPSFTVAANTVYDEGYGFSYLMQHGERAETIVGAINDHIDGVLYQNFDGKFTLKLIRDDYVLEDQPVFDQSNIIEVPSMSKLGWAETANSSMIEYVDWEDNFKSTNAVAYDLGNIEMRSGQQNVSKKKFPGCRNAYSAAIIAQRHLSQVSNPLVSLTLKTNRDAALLNPGDIINVTDPDFRLTNLALRIAEISRGNAASPQITIKGVQDIFAYPTDILFTGGQNTMDEGLRGLPAATTPEMRGQTWLERLRYSGWSSSSYVDLDAGVMPYYVMAEGRGTTSSTTAFELLQKTKDDSTYFQAISSRGLMQTALSSSVIGGTWKLGRVSDAYVHDGGDSLDTLATPWVAGPASFEIGDEIRTALSIYTVSDRNTSQPNSWDEGSEGVWAATLGTTEPTVVGSGTYEWSDDGPRDNDGIWEGSYKLTWAREADLRFGLPVIAFEDFGITNAFRTQSAEEIRHNGAGLIRINDEIMGYEFIDSVSAADGAWGVDPNQTQTDADLYGQSYSDTNTVTGISRIHRGLMDTDIGEHAPGDRVWFLSASDLPMLEESLPNGTDNQSFKMITASAFGKLPVDDAPVVTTVASQHFRPDMPMCTRNITMGSNAQGALGGAAGHNINFASDASYTVSHNQVLSWPSQYEVLPQSASTYSGGVAYSTKTQYLWQCEATSGVGNFNTVRTEVGGATGTNDQLLRNDLWTAMGWDGVNGGTGLQHKVRVTMTGIREYVDGSTWSAIINTSFAEPYREFYITSPADTSP